jgi:hypothetical protein
MRIYLKMKVGKQLASLQGTLGVTVDLGVDNASPNFLAALVSIEGAAPADKGGMFPEYSLNAP